MTTYSPFQIVLILIPFVLTFAFGLDIYIPVLSQMTGIFRTTPAMVQLTMSLFLLTTGVGQLFIGPLSDRYGRKKCFYLSSLFFAFGSLACAYSPDISWLIGFRIVSSLGACGMLVTALALVRDLFSSDRSARLYSFLNGAIGISPTFAPLIGGHLAGMWGWKSIFFFLAFLGLYSFGVTYFFIEETHPPDKRMGIDRKVFHRYLRIFRNRQFVIFAAIAGLGEAVFFGFFCTSPFVIIDLLGVSPQQFGYYFAVFGLVSTLGGIAGGKLIEKIGVYRTIKMGIVLTAAGGLLMLIFHLTAPLSMFGFLFPMTVACTGAVFMMGSAASLALEPFPAMAGTASAALGCTEFGISAITGAILMLFPVGSTFPYAVFILLLASCARILFAGTAVGAVPLSLRE